MNDLTIKPPLRHTGYKQGYNHGFMVGALSAAAIIFSILWLTSCTAPQAVTDPPLYQSGGLYQENDTIIGGDTLTYWTKD